MKKNERLEALNILNTLLQEKIPLTQLMAEKTALSPLSKEICFGVCRQYFRLAALADLLLTKRPKQYDVWLSLLIGLYQLHYLRIPDYAVVKETVALLEQGKKSWAKGLINAVLRRYCREQDTLIEKLEENHAFKYGHPTWLKDRIKTAWPKDWQHILQANDMHPPMSLRVNARHNTAKTYLNQLQQQNIEADLLSYSDSGLTLKTPCNVLELPGFSSGLVSVQDQAAQIAVSLLDLKPGLRLLDACAAPGGKTCHMLETEPDLNCIALDIDERRLIRVQENLNRLKLHAHLLKGDGLDPASWWDGLLFDRILLDAPCSATGVIRRHPDIKLLRTEAEITIIIKLQSELIKTLWSLLKPGGIMVYATCSILPEENEQQMAKFITSHDDCEFLTADQPWGTATGHGWQIMPGEQNMDGFFYSKLSKLL